MSWKIKFYEGVEEDILKLPIKLQARVLRLLELMEKQGANLGMPHTKPLTNDLFELRAKAKEGIARGIFCYQKGKTIIVLYVFPKKDQKIRKQDLDKADKRMRKVNNERFKQIKKEGL